MENRLGADFSDVRIHDDSAAKASAAEVGARAYTSGSHVVIGDGGGDKRTLAHELTHVIQQRQGPVAGADNGSGLKVSDPSDRFEREAEANAARAMVGSAPPQEVQRVTRSYSSSNGDTPLQRMAKGNTKGASGGKQGGEKQGGGKKGKSAGAVAESSGGPQEDIELISRTVGEHDVRVVMDSHQNKHQSPPIGELKAYTGGRGTKFKSHVDLNWHRANSAEYLVRCIPALFGEADTEELAWSPMGPGKFAAKKVAVDVNGQAVIFDAIATVKGNAVTINYHCNPPS